MPPEGTGRQSGRLKDKGRSTYTRDGRIIPAGQNVGSPGEDQDGGNASKKPRSGRSKGTS